MFQKDYYYEEENSSWLRQVGEFIVELIKVIIVSLAIIIPVRYFLIQPFYVKGASMEPNFYDHEYLIVDEISYRFNQPQRGEIVVFKYPQDPEQYFIKRIIGLPKERVEIKNGWIYIYNEEYPHGFKIEEDYLPPDIYTPTNQSVTLKEKEYFVLGDNRASSLDSRSFGPVNVKLIIGRAWLRGWPFDKIKIFEVPEY